MTDSEVILQDSAYDTALAIVGMSGRFPGAGDVQSFWHNLTQGVVAIQQFSEQELIAAGLDPALVRHPQYVRAGTVLDGIKDFDAAFFGFTPREAQCLDPQHRLFLECAWEALEQAGYPPDSYNGLIGVFAGSRTSDYREQNLALHKDLLDLVGKLQVSIGNDCDALASMVSYKMNLKGPGVSVQTFCSTSLVATHLACQSLLTYDCDLALAGGVALMLPQPSGYFYEEGGILSPDGQCRTFDGQSQGSVMGSGVGVVALKRLKEALEDGDHIYALIRGSAINNDGSVRVGYTAPGLNGQSAVIADAITQSGVPFESIGYIEAHGTGTKLGDAIELGALLKAFRSETTETGFCALGSAKPNVGHLDRASGVTGLIKAALSLYHKQLPPSLHFERTSADIHLESSPFFVNTQLCEWQPGSAGVRRAGVNSFGLGGTNAHVVLEEAPEREASSPGREWKVLPLAARSRQALSVMARRLAEHLNTHPTDELADVAYTLQVGRSPFLSRQTLVCRDTSEALVLLKAAADGPAVQQSNTRRPVVLYFPNETAYVRRAWELLSQEPEIQDTLKEVEPFLREQWKCGLTDLLQGNVGPERVACAALLWSYGVARLLQTWGVDIRAVGGEGTGALTALVVAGVLPLAQGLRLLLAHTQGAHEHTLTGLLQNSQLAAPTLPVASASSSGWLTETQARDPQQLLCQFGPAKVAVKTLLDEQEAVFLEMGSGSTLVQQALSAMPTQTETPVRTLTFFSSLESEQAQQALLRTVGWLWEHGVAINWKAFAAHEQRRRVPLPTYPFERQRFWVDQEFVQQMLATMHGEASAPAQVETKAARDDWFYLPTWKRADLPAVERPTLAHAYLVLLDEHGVGETLAKCLERRGARVMRVLPAGAGTAFTEEANGRSFRLDRTQRSDYQRLFERLAEEGTLPEHLIHCSSLTSADEVPAGAAGFQEMQERGLYTLLFLLQAYEQQTSGAALRVTLFSNNIQAVTGQETLWPEKSPLLGLAKVAAQENPDVLCRCIDLEGLPQTAEDYEPLLAEVLSRDNERTLAYRQGQRWSEAYTPEKVIAPTSLPFRSQGVYLITGGLGGVGLLLARELAQRVQARLVLVGRVGLPPRAEWTDWLLQHTPDDVTSRRIHLVQALEALGSSVLVCQADCADQAQMRTVIDQTIATFGELHGVIHAAGVSDSRAFGSVQELGREIYDWHFGPKVHGLYALQEVLSGYTLDFCVLFSSLSTILGGLGLAAYTAANRFMDAFAALHNRETAQPWICVNWDSWHVKERPHGDLGATIAVFTMDHEEGTDAFTRVLTAGKTHLVHSTGDLEARIRQWVYLDSLGGADTHHETTGPAPVPADYERILSEIWRQTLGLEQVGLTDNFFDLGGNSLTALQLISRIRKQLQVQLPAVAIFEAPTISAMVAYLKPEEDEESRELELLAQRRTQARQGLQRSDIAIIGMSGRFPGASSIDAYWQNLRNGVEALTYFSEEELLASGLDPALINDPAYVRARPVLKPEEVETFDAAFFGYSPREAELTDPQHRVFLECCWEALEMAGYDAERYPGMIGMFGGTNISSYILALTAHPELLDGIMDYQLVIGNDKDSLATGISYKMNLKGPSLSIQTFCSTSLVATHLACQSLLNGECDLALAGGVSLRIPTRSGYLYQEGGQESTDGHCYTFDARATGSNFGDGAGVVVLKRLADALADGDTIHAVIKGSAINNDGSLKVSYTAPSVNGQAEVVLRALEHAGVSAESITYVEAHGTATELGDPIEVASLTKAYRTQTRLTNFCAIGSVKTNVGHMDRASGVSGLIKVIEALKHHEIPASLNFESPNPAIDFANSPFYVNTSLTPWPRYGEPRRAAVNSLGMGGTNAHVIVEEAPEVAPSGPTRPAQILLLSARTPTALQAASQRLRDYMQNHPTVPLADIAYTLQIGRKQMEQRTMLVCQSREDALDQLANVLPVYEEKRTDRPVAFLFSGVGEQYAGMAGDLYEREAVFRECIDQCCTYLRQRFQLDLLPLFTESFTDSADTSGLDLRAMLGRGEGKTSSTRLSDPVEAQCSTFILEYALTRLLRSWGVRPQALLGYSLGEYLAATVAGVFSLEDALSLVVQRARLIAPLASGGMLAVFAPAEQVQTFLQPTDSLEIAIFTSPTACVLAGPTEGLLALSERLNEAGIVNRRVANGQAFHSSHMHEVREQLTRLVEATPRQVPSTPYLSNVTGEWITAELAQDASYWARHLCEPVRFSQCVERLLSEGEWILVEVGIGQLLSGAVKQHPACTRERAGAVIATLPSIYEQRSTQAALLRSLGQIWLHGGKIDWSGFSARERRQRVPLPTYPFERQRYWLLDGLKGRPAVSTERMIAGEMEKIENLSDWFFVPTWTRMPWPLPTGNRETTAPWLLFMDECGVSAHIRERLLQRGTPVIAVYPGASYAQRQMREFQVRPAERDDYNTLLQTLARQGLLPERLVHCWSVTGTDETDLSVSALSERGFYSLLATAQALGNLGNQQFQIDVISTDMQDVTGNEALVPIKALLTGPCKVIQQEYNHIRCRSIDLAWDEWSPQQGDALYKELLAPLTDTAIALRGRHRWVQTYEPLKLAEAQPEELPLRQEGVYLIIGGLGGIGLALAEHLARTVQARLVLVGRTGLPARSQWDELLQSQGSETGIGRRIQQVQMIESLGAHVLPIAADIADEEQMQAVIDLTLATFGALHGIIHAAALPPSGLIQLKSPAQAAAVLAPKVQGTLVLERILAKQELDFLLFFSSMSSSTGGGPGQVDYCAANAFLDAFAHKHSNDYGMTIAIDWGEWLWDAWADGLEGFPPEVRRYFIEKRRDYGISFIEGMEAMTRILARRLTHVVVATQDFPRMVEGSKSFSIDAIIGAVTTLRKMQATAYPRPALSTPYVAPETELEEEIVQIWGELLGIEQIGIHDNFFELGGHSLIGSQLIARLRQSFQVNLSLELIFESATVAELAAAIELALIEEIEQADTSTVA